MRNSVIAHTLSARKNFVRVLLGSVIFLERLVGAVTDPIFTRFATAGVVPLLALVRTRRGQ